MQLRLIYFYSFLIVEISNLKIVDGKIRRSKYRKIISFLRCFTLYAQLTRQLKSDSINLFKNDVPRATTVHRIMNFLQDTDENYRSIRTKIDSSSSTSNPIMNDNFQSQSDSIDLLKKNVKQHSKILVLSCHIVPFFQDTNGNQRKLIHLHQPLNPIITENFQLENGSIRLLKSDFSRVTTRIQILNRNVPPPPYSKRATASTTRRQTSRPHDER